MIFFQLRKSGSTGKPKGVDVTHRNVTNLLTIASGNLGIKPGRRVAQLLSVSFDMGRLLTWSPLKEFRADCFSCMGNIRYFDEWRNTVHQDFRLE